MKITSFYYLNYPDDKPKDLKIANSEVYVEIGGDDASINKFDSTYSFKVYTLGYLEKEIVSKGKKFIIDRSVIIVDSFEDNVIEAALESVLNDIDFFGEKK